MNVWFKQNGVYKTYLGIHNFTLDICQYLSGGVNSMMTEIFFGNMKHYTNLISGCPLKVTLIQCTILEEFVYLNSCSFQLAHYYVKEFKVDDKNFPPNLRTGDYRILLVYYSKEEKRNVNLYTVRIDIFIRTKSYRPQ